MKNSVAPTSFYKKLESRRRASVQASLALGPKVETVRSCPPYLVGNAEHIETFLLKLPVWQDRFGMKLACVTKSLQREFPAAQTQQHVRRGWSERARCDKWTLERFF